MAVTPSAPLVTATTHAIELALGASTPGGVGILREAMRRLCVDAQRRGVRPEELIVLFKMTWRSHPEARALRRGEANALLEQVIRICIEEYYAGGLGH